MNTIRKKRRLKRKIRETLTALLIGIVGATALLGMFVLASVQTSERLAPVMAAEVAE